MIRPEQSGDPLDWARWNAWLDRVQTLKRLGRERAQADQKIQIAITQLAQEQQNPHESNEAELSHEQPGQPTL